MNARMNRRGLLRGLGAVSGAVLVSGAAAVPASAQQPPPTTPSTTPTPKAWYELGFLNDPVLENQLLHYLAAVYSAQADVGEVLDTVGMNGSASKSFAALV